MDADTLLRRLREQPEHVERFVSLGLDHLLDRPARELVDPKTLAPAIAEGVRASAASDEFETWLRERVETALDKAGKVEGPLAERVPITVLVPIQTALGREIVPDPQLVRAVLDHPSLRELIREVLQANLLEFARRMRSLVPEGAVKRVPGGGLASRLAGAAKGVAQAVGTGVEAALESRVKAFVDDALGAAVDTVVNRMCAEDFAEPLAKWRVDVLHGLLAQPVERMVAQRHRYPPEDFAADVAAVVKALASWRSLTEAVEGALEQLLESGDARTLREWLEGSGLEEAWRPPLEEALLKEAHALVADEAFEAWLSDVMA